MHIHVENVSPYNIEDKSANWTGTFQIPPPPLLAFVRYTN